jgi:hypothetical protein
MNTHTDHTYDTKEMARQAMHKFIKGQMEDKLSHHVWGKTTQPLRADGQKDKKTTQYITELDNGKFMIRVEI